MQVFQKQKHGSKCVQNCFHNKGGGQSKREMRGREVRGGRTEKRGNEEEEGREEEEPETLGKMEFRGKEGYFAYAKRGCSETGGVRQRVGVGGKGREGERHTPVYPS